jgi:hypothetical protein
VATPNVSISGINAMYWGNVLGNRANLQLRLYYTKNIITTPLEAPPGVKFGT